MKKFRYMLILFIVTLIIGGTKVVSAYTTEEPLVDFKADYLQTGPHYSYSKTKYNWGGQEVRVDTTTGNKTVLIAMCNEFKEFVTSDYTWVSFKPGNQKNVGNDAAAIPTEITGFRYKLRTKLPSPWTQVKINGLWIIDK